MPENAPSPTRTAPIRLQLNPDAREVLIDTVVSSVASGGPPRDMNVVDKLRDAAARGTDTIELTDEDVLTVNDMWNNIYSDEAPEELLGAGGPLAAIAAEASRLRHEGATPAIDTTPPPVTRSVGELLDDLEANHQPGGIWTRRIDADGSALIGLTSSEGEGVRITLSPTADSYRWASSIYETGNEGGVVGVEQREGTATYAEMLSIVSDLIDRTTPSTVGSYDVGPTEQRPYASILMSRVAASYPDASWKLYENDAYAQSLEYSEYARINVTEEARLHGGHRRLHLGGGALVPRR